MTDPAVAAAAAPVVDPPPAAEPEPAPVLTQVTIRKATNGLIVTGVYTHNQPGMPFRNLPQPEFVFATSADMLTWLKGEGWTL